MSRNGKKLTTAFSQTELDINWDGVKSFSQEDIARGEYNSTIAHSSFLEKKISVGTQTTMTGDAMLSTQKSFVSTVSSSQWDRPKRIAICTAASFIALCVGLQFGALSIEDATEWSNYLYRFIPSSTVNFMGALIAIQDLLPLFAKLKKDPVTHKRDLAVMGPFTVAFILMVFAVVSTLPLAKDSTAGLLKPDGWFSQKVGLSDQSRTALQSIGMIMWGLGYTATTRIDTGYAIARKLYEGILMRCLQPDRYAMVMLSRDIKRFPDQASVVWGSKTSSLVSAEEVKAFYIAVKEAEQAKKACGLPSKNTVTKAMRATLMLGCVPLTALLQDESERGWSEIDVKNSIANIMLGALATAAAFIFFVRSSQLFPERLMLAFTNVASRLENCGANKNVARVGAAFYLLFLGAIAFGSSFGWYYEAQQFERSSNPLQKVAFPGYEEYFAFYALLANFGFELNFTNRCINTAKKHEVSVPKAALQILTGLFTLQDKRSESAKAAENRLTNLDRGKHETDSDSDEDFSSMRQSALGGKSCCFKRRPTEDASPAEQRGLLGSRIN